MARAWGTAWGASWGSAWGVAGVDPPEPPAADEPRNGAGRFLDDDWPVYQRRFIEEQNRVAIARAIAITIGSMH